MRRTKPDVAAVIVTYCSEDVIADALESLRGIDRDTAGVRVFVADNASTDGTRKVVETFPEVTLVELPGNRGYAAGVNAGALAAGDFDHLLVLNADLVVEPDSVARLLDAQASSGAGIVAPRLVNEAGITSPSLRRDPSIPRAFGEALLTGRLIGRVSALAEMDRCPDHYETARDVDWVSGAAFLVSRACWDAVGPMDESMFLYSEEVDYALRARDLGFAVRYEPDAVVRHVGGESFVSPYLRTIQALNRVRFYRRRHGLAASVVFYLAVLVNEARRSVSPACRAATIALLRPSRRPAPLERVRLLRVEQPELPPVPLAVPGGSGPR